MAKRSKKMTYTPGPWTMTEQGSPSAYVEGDDKSIGIETPDQKVAAVEGWDNALANARLIAAAPELLAALEREHPKFMHMGFGPVGRTETGSYIHGVIDYGKECETCAVMAKARGETDALGTP